MQSLSRCNGFKYFAKDLRDNKDFLFSICLTERKVLLSLNDFMFCFKASSGERDGCSKFSFALYQ